MVNLPSITQRQPVQLVEYRVMTGSITGREVRLEVEYMAWQQRLLNTESSDGTQLRIWYHHDLEEGEAITKPLLDHTNLHTQTHIHTHKGCAARINSRRSSGAVDVSRLPVRPRYGHFSVVPISSRPFFSLVDSATLVNMYASHKHTSSNSFDCHGGDPIRWW